MIGGRTRFRKYWRHEIDDIAIALNPSVECHFCILNLFVFQCRERQCISARAVDLVKRGTGNLHGLFPTEFLKNGGTGNTEEYARMC